MRNISTEIRRPENGVADNKRRTQPSARVCARVRVCEAGRREASLALSCRSRLERAELPNKRRSERKVRSGQEEVEEGTKKKSPDPFGTSEDGSPGDGV